MGIMGEEAKKEATEFPYRVASPEFFFLLQRIDRLDEKLSARIDQVEGKLKPLIWATLGIVLASLALTVSVVIKVW